MIILLLLCEWRIYVFVFSDVLDCEVSRLWINKIFLFCSQKQKSVINTSVFTQHTQKLMS